MMHDTLSKRVRQEALDHSEGSITRRIENQAAKLPSDVWFGAALGSIDWHCS